MYRQAHKHTHTHTRVHTYDVCAPVYTHIQLLYNIYIYIYICICIYIYIYIHILPRIQRGGPVEPKLTGSYYDSNTLNRALGFCRTHAYRGYMTIWMLRPDTDLER